ncbi:hypothetical protein [Marinilactibacillus piezotolerans]|uniref:hypothetical protein n=1 Tax=Marinilactibacillus piezotolerans TaxID=258723 RepID=UPI0009B0EC0C|nr:hypothetical protein [Marinilactibacillus piezotolerans]
MATKPMDGLLGSKDKYKVNKEAKRYTLKDHGFIEGKNGAFQYERTLSRSVSDSTAPKLKITISRDLSELKIVTVSANGLKKVDIHKDENLEQARLMVKGIFETFLEENVLERA